MRDAPTMTFGSYVCAALLIVIWLGLGLYLDSSEHSETDAMQASALSLEDAIAQARHDAIEARKEKQ